MADADKYKPQDGDVDDWVAKVQAMAEAVAKGETDAAEILAFLDANSNFVATGNPTPQSSQYSYTAATGDNALYTITDASPYTALNGGELFIITFPSANTGAVDIKVDALVQKNLFKDGAELAGGEVEGTHVIQYDVLNDRMNMVESKASGVTILRKTVADTPYQIVAADFKTPFLRVLVDASGGDVIIKAPAPADYKNKELTVLAETDPAGNKVETQKSGGTEWHTSVGKQDFVRVMSDGTNETVLDHYESHYCRVYVDADESFAQGALEQVINLSTHTNIGNFWETTSGTLPFDCDVRADFTTLGTNIIPTIKIDTEVFRNPATSVAGQNAPTFSHDITGLSGNAISLWGLNSDNNTGARIIMGDAAGNESFATIKLRRVY